MRGEPAVTETVYEYDGDRLVRSTTVTEPEYSELDRGLLLALLAEKADVCTACGHPAWQCRDPKTAGQWQVVETVCQPTRVAQAAAENVAADKRRGVLIMTRRT